VRLVNRSTRDNIIDVYYRRLAQAYGTIRSLVVIARRPAQIQKEHGPSGRQRQTFLRRPHVAYEKSNLRIMLELLPGHVPRDLAQSPVVPNKQFSPLCQSPTNQTQCLIKAGKEDSLSFVLARHSDYMLDLGPRRDGTQQGQLCKPFRANHPSSSEARTAPPDSREILRPRFTVQRPFPTL